MQCSRPSSVLKSAGDSKKRWLTYNMLGGISSREDGDFCAVEVSFHDAARHRRVPLLTDFYHFNMASLSAVVCISSPSKRCIAVCPHGECIQELVWQHELPDAL